MFIPRGKALYENLATSYVMVDALVADLCEGGFSGAVEVTLSDAEAYVVVARGQLAAVVETCGEARNETGARSGSHRAITLGELAEAARRERGRVSIYNYSPGLAEAIASRITASALYKGLSTEFADLEKMISKLMRERDRQWFVEVRQPSGATTLAHIKDDVCRLISSEDYLNKEENAEVELSDNTALRGLLDECSAQVCTFDVYYKSAAQETQSSLSAKRSTATAESDEQPDISTVVQEAKAIYSSLSLDDAAEDSSSDEPPRAATAEAGGPSADAEPHSFAEPLSFDEAVDEAVSQEEELMEVAEEARGAAQVEPMSDAIVMAEIKRLMGDIARTIEEATRAVEQRDAFSMYLRAGQLKMAEAYPFLDPFGAEFEYLGGEIAFVGKAKPDEFVEGLTKAMKLAVEAVAQSSAQSARLRARVDDDLRWLYERHQQEFQQYGLDKTIGELISA